MQWGSLAPGDDVDVSTSGATMMGSGWSQKEYWQKTKLERYWGSPVACRIFSCNATRGSKVKQREAGQRPEADSRDGFKNTP